VSRRKRGGDVVVDVLFFALRLVWLLLLAVVLLVRVLLIVAVPRKTRSNYRQTHGRQRVDPGTGKVVPAKSSVISARQDRMVKAADRNRCVARHLGGCEGEPRGRWFYEVDHGVPWIAGGYTWLPNLFLLCFFHNQTKCSYNVDRDGYVHYRPSSYGGVNDEALAAQIRAAEQRARRDPMRWVRALRAR
jgi:hypothetical protein